MLFAYLFSELQMAIGGKHLFMMPQQLVGTLCNNYDIRYIHTYITPFSITL